MRSKKAFYNSAAALALEFVTVICGFILPRLILVRFGSNYNGIISSITQFLSYIALLSTGVGGVTRAALYKPLAEGDIGAISAIMRATENFMRKVALIFGAALVAFAGLYPLLAGNNFEWLFTFSLVLILGISTLAQYYFGISCSMIIQADQRQYVASTVKITTTILNTIIAAVLIKSGATIHVVKLGSAIVFAFNPIVMYAYVHKKYGIIRGIAPNDAAIKQRWDAFAHQIAGFVRSNTDIIILTIFSNFKEISVYTIYYMVASGIRRIVITFSGGMEAAFGNMIAKGEGAALKRNVRIYEFIVFSAASAMFTTAALLIVSFVALYTKGVSDVNYTRPAFAYIICIAEFLFCIRLPYQAAVQAAGHYRQTRNGSIFEAILNITISLALAKPFGIMGVAIGTLCAMLFRTAQYAIYMSKHIVVRGIWEFIKRFTISIFNSAAIVLVVRIMPLYDAIDYFGWVCNGFIVFGVAIVITVLIGTMVYRKDMLSVITMLKNLLSRKRAKSSRHG